MTGHIFDDGTCSCDELRYPLSIVLLYLRWTYIYTTAPACDTTGCGDFYDCIAYCELPCLTSIHKSDQVLWSYIAKGGIGDDLKSSMIRSWRHDDDSTISLIPTAGRTTDGWEFVSSDGRCFFFRILNTFFLAWSRPRNTYYTYYQH